MGADQTSRVIKTLVFKEKQIFIPTSKIFETFGQQSEFSRKIMPEEQSRNRICLKRSSLICFRIVLIPFLQVLQTLWTFFDDQQRSFLLFQIQMKCLNFIICPCIRNWSTYPQKICLWFCFLCCAFWMNTNAINTFWVAWESTYNHRMLRRGFVWVIYSPEIRLLEVILIFLLKWQYVEWHNS